MNEVMRKIGMVEAHRSYVSYHKNKSETADGLSIPKFIAFYFGTLMFVVLGFALAAQTVLAISGVPTWFM